MRRARSPAAASASTVGTGVELGSAVVVVGVRRRSLPLRRLFA